VPSPHAPSTRAVARALLVPALFVLALALAWLVLDPARRRAPRVLGAPAEEGVTSAPSTETGAGGDAPRVGDGLALAEERGEAHAELPASSSAERRAARAEAPSSAPLSQRERELLASTDPRLRFEGLRLLARRGAPEAVDSLLAFLEETRDSERMHLQRLSAVSLLGELEGSEPGLRALYEGADPGLRRGAAKALEARGDTSLVEREIAGLRPSLADPDGGERARAAQEVARLASPAAVPLLLGLLADDNSDVRFQAIDGLRLAGDASVAHALEPLLEDRSARVRALARRTLESLRGTEPAGER